MVLNITYNIDEDKVEEWLEFLTLSHLPAIRETELLKNSRTYKIYAEGAEGINFAVQYLTTRENLDDLHQVVQQHLNEELRSRFGDSIVYFATVLEEISG